MPCPERYRKGIWLFNHRYFFECHEVLEEEWMESIGREKIFYQMIIQAAVVFVHWESGNRRGVLSLEHTFQQKAEAVGAGSYQGLDIARLRREMAVLVSPLRQNPSLPLPEFTALITPELAVTGTDPLACGPAELRILGRQDQDD